MASPGDSSPSLRLLRGGCARNAVSYTNRLGVTYYLHEIVTKQGQRRLVPRRALTDGALQAMPAGHDFYESLAGRVSVRRTRGRDNRVPIADFELVRSVLAWHVISKVHIAERRPDAIVIHEPDPEAYERAWWEARENPEFSFASHLGDETASMRAAMQFQLVEQANTPGLLYAASGPETMGEPEWQEFERGRLADLAVRYLPRLKCRVEGMSPI